MVAVRQIDKLRDLTDVSVAEVGGMATFDPLRVGGWEVQEVVIFDTNANGGAGAYFSSLVFTPVGDVGVASTQFNALNSKSVESTQSVFSVCTNDPPDSTLQILFQIGGGTHKYGSMTVVEQNVAFHDLVLQEYAGNVGIGTNDPTVLLDVNSDTLRLRNKRTISSSTDSGQQGEHCYDDNYFYVCTATNTWKRFALSTW